MSLSNVGGGHSGFTRVLSQILDRGVAARSAAPSPVSSLTLGASAADVTEIVIEALGSSDSQTLKAVIQSCFDAKERLPSSAWLKLLSVQDLSKLLLTVGEAEMHEPVAMVSKVLQERVQGDASKISLQTRTDIRRMYKRVYPAYKRDKNGEESFKNPDFTEAKNCLDLLRKGLLTKADHAKLPEEQKAVPLGGGHSGFTRVLSQILDRGVAARSAAPSPVSSLTLGASAADVTELVSEALKLSDSSTLAVIQYCFDAKERLPSSAWLKLLSVQELSELLLVVGKSEMHEPVSMVLNVLRERVQGDRSKISLQTRVEIIEMSNRMYPASKLKNGKESVKNPHFNEAQQRLNSLSQGLVTNADRAELLERQKAVAHRLQSTGQVVFVDSGGHMGNSAFAESDEGDETGFGGAF